MNGSEPPPVAHVALYIRPLALVLRQPAVDVAIEIAPVEPLIESADVVVVEVPSIVVVAK